MMYQCANCEGSGYFDLPDDTEKACSVCGGAGEVDYDAAIARAEAAEAECEELKLQIKALQIIAQPLSPKDSGLAILLARQTVRAEAAEAERNALDDLARKTVEALTETARRERARADALDAECERLRETLASEHSRALEAEKQIDVYRQDLQSCKSERARYGDRMTDKMGTLERERDEWKARAEAAEAEAAECRAEVVRLRAALNNEKQWALAFAGDVKAEMDRADVAETEIERLRASEKQACVERDAWRKACDSAHDDIVAMETETERMRTELSKGDWTYQRVWHSSQDAR